MPDLSVSVVSYRTPSLLRAVPARARAAALGATTWRSPSSTTPRAMARPTWSPRDFPWVRLIRNDRNRRLRRRAQSGAAPGRGRYCLILNSDATPRPGALRTLVDFLDAHPSVAVAGPKLRYPDGTVQPSRRRFPTVATLFPREHPAAALLAGQPAAAPLLRRRSFGRRAAGGGLAGRRLPVRPRQRRCRGRAVRRALLHVQRRAGSGVDASAPPAGASPTCPRPKSPHLEGGSSRLDLAARDRLFQASKLQYAAKWHGAGVAAALRAYLIVEYLARAGEESLKLALGSRARRAARTPARDRQRPAARRCAGERRGLLFVSGEYPPDVGGVGDYTDRLRAALAGGAGRAACSADAQVRRWDARSLLWLLRAAPRGGVVHIQYQAGAYDLLGDVCLMPACCAGCARACAS